MRCFVKIAALLILSLLLSSCLNNEKLNLPENCDISYSENGINHHLTVEYVEGYGNRIILDRYKQKDQISSEQLWLDYDIYQLKIGDVDNNGSVDVCVGVIKSCQYDSRCQKRLFVFENRDGCLTPLWLGTYLAFTLDDFKIYEDNGLSYIATIERDEDYNFLVVQYGWGDFGPVCKSFLLEKANYHEAEKLFKSL